MRILLHEHYSSRPPGAVAGALRRAGRAIRDAAARELRAVRGVDLVVVPSSSRADAAFRRALANADAALVIAPEAHGRLGRLAGEIERSRALPLGPGPRAVRIAGDKLETARLLARAGVATPAAWPVAAGPAGIRSLRRRVLPLVLKPRDGCGSEGVTIVRRARDLGTALRRARDAARGGAVIAQAHAAGDPLSVSLLVRAVAGADGRCGAADEGGGVPGSRRAAAGALVLGVGRQRIAGRRALRYLGGEIPVTGRDAAAAARLAMRATAALAAAAPDLRGPLGVDLVVGAGGVMVIEMNPRLTTSWVGLRRVARRNLAGLLIDAARGRRLPRRLSLAGRCRFGSGGRVASRRAGS